MRASAKYQRMAEILCSSRWSLLAYCKTENRIALEIHRDAAVWAAHVVCSRWDVQSRMARPRRRGRCALAKVHGLSVITDDT